MEGFIEELMLTVNSSVISRKFVDWELINAKIEKACIEDFIKDKIRAIKTLNPVKYNAALFDLKENLIDQMERDEKAQKLLSPVPLEVLEEYYKRFDKYMFDMIQTPHFITSKKCKKVYLGHLDNIWGADIRGNKEELEQQGRLYIWEALRKFGKRPDVRKNFKERNRQMDVNGISSASTFVYGAVFNQFINLGKKCLGKKYTGVDENGKALYASVHVEYDEEIYSRASESKYEFEVVRDEVDKKTWTKLCNELNVSQDSTSIFTRSGGLMSSKEFDSKRR